MNEIDRLIAEGKDPLDAIFVTPTDEQQREDVDDRLRMYLNKMPKDVKKRLAELINERIAKSKTE